MNLTVKKHLGRSLSVLFALLALCCICAVTDKTQSDKDRINEAGCATMFLALSVLSWRAGVDPSDKPPPPLLDGK